MSDHSLNEKTQHKDGVYVEGSYDHERDSLAEAPTLKRQLKNRHSTSLDFMSPATMPSNEY